MFSEFTALDLHFSRGAVAIMHVKHALSSSYARMFSVLQQILDEQICSGLHTDNI